MRSIRILYTLPALWLRPSLLQKDGQYGFISYALVEQPTLSASIFPEHKNGKKQTSFFPSLQNSIQRLIIGHKTSRKTSMISKEQQGQDKAQVISAIVFFLIINLQVGKRMGNQHGSDQYSKISRTADFQEFGTQSEQKQHLSTYAMKGEMERGRRVAPKNASKNVFDIHFPVKEQETKEENREILQRSPVPSNSILEEDDAPPLHKYHSSKEQKQTNEDDNEDTILESSCSQMSIREQNVFDYYKVKRCLGKDEHKATFQVQHIDNQEIRCMKVIPKVYFRNKQLVKGENEIDNLSKICHKNVIKLLQVFEDINTYYLILQYIEGHNLLKLASAHSCSEALVKQITQKILLALQAIHTKGIVHRDIRLENIILYEQNNKLEIKIINFGLSIDLDSSDYSKHPYGQLFYAPPESYDGVVNEKYDIWSVGILTMLMFTCNAQAATLKKLQIRELARKRALLKEQIKKISQNVKEFAMDLMVTKNKRRPTAEKALMLEWLSGRKTQRRRLIRSENLDEEILYKF